MNPFYGRALEKARVASEGGVWSEELPESVQQRPIGKPVQEIDFWDDDGRLSSSARLPAGDEDFWEDEPSSGTRRQNSSARWVTIDHRHVLIEESRAGKTHSGRAHSLSARDEAYLDKYYDAVAALAKQYDVDPALVLGVGTESGFASAGTYLRTGDAFGMTGGSTKHMTTAASPEQNVSQFFANYGSQIRGTGSDAAAFINALQGRNPSDKTVKGWKIYNTVNSTNWNKMVTSGIARMRREVPIYLSQRAASSGTR